MPRERLPMRKIRDVLRLHASGLSKRQIAVSLNIGRTAARDYIDRAIRAGLSWPPPDGLTDEDLERLLFPPPTAVAPDRRVPPNWPALHRELKKPGVTLSLLGDRGQVFTGDRGQVFTVHTYGIISSKKSVHSVK